MNTLIILAAITIVVVYGNDCSSTYNTSRIAERLQYNNTTIQCNSMGTIMCTESINRFRNEADSTTNQIGFMINNEAFKFNNPNVSLEIYIIASHTTFHLISFHRNQNIYKAVILKQS